MSIDREQNADTGRMEEDILTAEEAELRALMKASAYAPPADLKAQVMRRIRAERARTAHRRFLKRITAAVCAAVILVPALVILLPILRGGNDSAVKAPSRLDNACEAYEDYVLSASGASGETLFDTKTAADAVYDASTEDAQDEAAAENFTSAAPMFTPPPKDAVSDGTENAVDLPAEAEPGEPGNAGSAASCAPIDVETEEPAFYEVLRALVGADAFDEWLAQYDGSPDHTEQAAYEYFGLTE